MYAITVKVLPATNTKPRRFKAIWGHRSLICGDSIDDTCPYFKAAKEIAKLGGIDLSNLLQAWVNGWVDETTKVFVKL